IAKATQIIIERYIGVVIAMDPAVRDDIKPCILLVQRNRADDICKGLPVHRIRRFLIAGEVASPGRIPPARIWVVPDHARRNQNLFASDLHGFHPLIGLTGPSLILRVAYLTYPWYVKHILSSPG